MASKEPVRVAVIFEPGKRLRPVWFEREHSKFAVKEVTYFWRDCIGDKIQMHFTVTDGETVCELVFSPSDSTWKLSDLRPTLQYPLKAAHVACQACRWRWSSWQPTDCHVCDRRLSEDDLGKLLDEAYIMDPSFLGEEERTRISLAGVQDKLPVAIHGDTISLPLDGSPSTHILKSRNPRFPTLMENEVFCMTLARAMGLVVPTTFLRRIRANEFVYLVERYDRIVDKEGGTTRIHQEDFCQATGTSYRLKYEEKGGPGFRACFQVIGRCRKPLADRIKLVELAIFNYLIGNADCHAKNISLLYDNGPNPSLAPFYDLVCTGIYNLSRQTAMAIGGVYDPRDIDTKAWRIFAEQAGIRSPKPIMDTLKRMAASIPGKAAETAAAMIERYGDSPVYGQVIEVIEQRTRIALRQI